MIGSYHDELRKAMVLLSEQPNSVFVGQGVARHGGTSMSSTFCDVPEQKLIEFPVAEELQMGACTGMALEGMLPVCIFPRWNFVLRAADQIVNHLDRLPLYSKGGYCPKVIIRVAVPSVDPFNPGPQHDADFTDAFSRMLRTVKTYRIYHETEVLPFYKDALAYDGSSILVEYTKHYRNERGKEAA